MNKQSTTSQASNLHHAQAWQLAACRLLLLALEQGMKGRKVSNEQASNAVRGRAAQRATMSADGGS